jgi:hypothetical protein
MYDPTRLELIRSKEEDRRRALAGAAHRHQARAQARPPPIRRPSITLAGYLRRTADRLVRRVRCDEERSPTVARS